MGILLLHLLFKRLWSTSKFDDLMHGKRSTQDCDFNTLTITRWVDSVGSQTDEATYSGIP
jgi:hypothetical protein